MGIRTSRACYYSNKCAAILSLPKTAAQMLQASTKTRHRCAKFAREPWSSLHRAVPGHHLCCVPARRLMTARTKPGTQSECAASWLDKDGNSCGRGCRFLVRTWRAVSVGKSCRGAPLRRCPRTNRAPSPRLWSLSCLPTSVVAPCQLAPVSLLRCLSLKLIVRWTLQPRASGSPFVSGPSPLPTALTCYPLWVRQPTALTFPGLFAG